MLNKVLDLLFGKAPDIFDSKGNVLHKLPEDRWKSWNERFQKREYNWRDHKGTERKITPPPTQAKK
jgi:hypothetical protein